MNEPFSPDASPAAESLEGALDLALRLAFGPEEPRLGGGSSSVLQTLGADVGRLPHVSLRNLQKPSARPARLPPLGDGTVPPRHAGRYRVVGEIARGGIGAVYRVRDVDLGRDLALKSLVDSYIGNADMTRRLVEEAQICGQLQHPGIVPIHELGLLARNKPYFTMKLVEGQTLAALLEARQDVTVERRRFLGIFEQVSQTVAYAHARGVIHRDLKPSNVMVGAFGEVQVVDWGLAKVISEHRVAERWYVRNGGSRGEAVTTVRRGSKSMAGSIMGTPAYMAPEQARGEVENVDERTDVFGLGAVLCEILTGKPPYEAGSTEELHENAKLGELDDSRTRLRACGADAEIVHLATRCLAPQREERPRNAGEVAREVGAYLASFEERARASELAVEAARVRAQDERKARRLTVALAATVVVAACLGSAGYLWVEKERRGRLEETRTAVREALEEATMLQGRAEVAGQDTARWSEALVAARGAEALLTGREADLETANRVHRVVARIKGAAREARVHAERVAAESAFLDRLEDVRIPRKEKVGDIDPQEMDQAYAATFRESGMDVDQVEVEVAARRISSRSNHLLVAAALDDWARYRKQVAPEKDGPGSWRHLVEVARRADADPWRDDLRAELLKADLCRLQHLARSARSADLPAVTWNLLAVHLKASGDVEGAAAVYREALARYPQDFWLNFEMGQTLEELETPRWGEAVGYYRSALAVWPKNAMAWYRLGHSLFHAGRSEESLSAFEQSIRLKPDFPAPHALLGLVLHERNLAEAIAHSREALRLEPENPTAHSNLGRSLEAGGDLDGAAAAYREALRLKPDLVNARYNLGNVLREKGDLDGAIVSYREALRLEPDHAEAHDRLGAALKDKGDLEGALSSLKEAIRLRPDSGDFHFNVGLTLRAGGDLAGAIQSFREAVRLRPTYARPYVHLGVALSVAGDHDGGIAQLREALRLEPGYARAHTNLGIILRKKGDLEAAIASHRRALRLEPGYVKAHFNLANALKEKGDLEAAAAGYREALRLEPDLVGAHLNLGHVLRQKGDLEGALAQFEAEIRIAPDSSEARLALGTSFVARGDYELALAQFKEAIRLERDNARAHYNLGFALGRMNDLEGAIASYREALRLEPDYAEAHCNLGHTLGRAGDFRAALSSLRRGHELGSRRPDWRYPSAAWVRGCEEIVKLENALGAIERGEKDPTDAELLPLGRLCYQKGLYWESARFYIAGGDRYNAARAAVLGGCGHGKEQSRRDERARAALRRQAVEWLRAELASLASSLETGGSEGRERVRRTLEHWRRDKDLSGLRDTTALAERPAAEREACQALWAEVDDLLRRAAGPSEKTTSR